MGGAQAEAVGRWEQPTVPDEAKRRAPRPTAEEASAVASAVASEATAAPRAASSGQMRYTSVMIWTPSFGASSPRSAGARRAKADAVAETPTQSGTTAFARSACARRTSASAAACSVTAAISLPRATDVLPTYSALSPIAAESAAIDGTSTSTSFTGSTNGEPAATATVDVSTNSSVFVSCDRDDVTSSSRSMSRFILCSDTLTGSGRL